MYYVHVGIENLINFSQQKIDGHLHHLNDLCIYMYSSSLLGNDNMWSGTCALNTLRFVVISMLIGKLFNARKTLG